MLSETLNHQHPAERVKQGKVAEGEIIDFVNKQFFLKRGFALEPSSHHEDTKKKIDGWVVAPNGKRYSAQIKGRASEQGKDILVCIFEPFYGLDNPNTRRGRDYLNPVGFYICRSKDDYLYVISGERLKKVVDELVEEWKAEGGLKFFQSSKYEGCEFRHHYDKYNGNPKILCFIRPTSLKLKRDYHKLRMS